MNGENDTMTRRSPGVADGGPRTSIVSRRSVAAGVAAAAAALTWRAGAAEAVEGDPGEPRQRELSLAHYLPAGWTDGQVADSAFQALYAAIKASVKTLPGVGITASGGAAEPRATVHVYIPPGIYKLTQDSVLCGVISAEGTQVGLTYRGAGPENTQVVWQPTSAANYLIRNENWRSVALSNIGFRSMVAGARFMLSTVRPAPTAPATTPPPTAPQDYTFDHVLWAGDWSECIRLDGVNNNSEFMFTRCVVNGTYSTAFLHTPPPNLTGGGGSDQFLNFDFYSCKIEYTSGTFLLYEGGGNINVVGGSYIHTGATSSAPALFFDLRGNTHASGVQRFWCSGIRLEHRSPYSSLIRCEWGRGSVHFASIDQDSQRAVAGNNTAVTALFTPGNNPGPSILFESSALSGRHEYVIASDSWRWNSRVSYESCVIVNWDSAHDFIVNTGTLNPGGRPVAQFTNCRGSGANQTVAGLPRRYVFDCAVNWDVAVNAVPSVRIVRFSHPEGRIVAPVAAGGRLPLPVVLPVNAVPRTLQVFRPAGGASAATDWSYTLKNGSGQIIATVSAGGTAWNAGFAKVVTIPARQLTAESDRTLTLEVAGSQDNASVAAQVLLEYLA